MAEIGNTIPAPTGKYSLTFDIRQELLYSSKDLQQRGVTLKPGQGVLLLGTALKKDTSSNYYVKATSAATTAGFLRQTTDTGADSSGDAWQANIVYGGWLKFNLASSANSFDLSGITASRVNTVRNFFRF